MSIELRWLGQAGFAIRSAATTVVVDPYLSDLCLAVHGLQRQIAAPATPSSLGAHAVLISHWHEDHLDLDSAAEFADSGATFIAPPSCIARLAGRGIAAGSLTAISAGETVHVGDTTITATPARHMVAGFLTEDAVGYLIEADGVRVYHSGDTDYDRSLLAATDRGPLDVALLCVNGTGGNMNAWEAAALAAQLAPALAVPIHFGMWPEAGYGPGATLDPDQFRRLYQQLSDGGAVEIPDVDHPITVPR